MHGICVCVCPLHVVLCLWVGGWVIGTNVFVYMRIIHSCICVHCASVCIYICLYSCIVGLCYWFVCCPCLSCVCSSFV